MCGILCILSTNNHEDKLEFKNISTDIQNSLRKRGPDKSDVHLCEDGLIFVGCVLWQQGFQLTSQPIISNNFILLLNGDIYNANKVNATSDTGDDALHAEISDTSWLLKELDKCENDGDIVNLFKTIKGPFSVIFYNKIHRTLYFFRDSLGRNSLLIEKDNGILRILSTSTLGSGKTTVELPPFGIFKLNIASVNDIELYPWKTLSEDNFMLLENFIEEFQFNLTEIFNPIDPEWLVIKENFENTFDFSEVITNIGECDLFPTLVQIDKIKDVVCRLTQLIENSVKERIFNTPPYCTKCIKLYLLEKGADLACNHSKIGILFSGGIDCTILAAIAQKYISSTDSIDLLNVAFQSATTNSGELNWNVPDRLSAIESYNELRKLFPSRKWNLVEVNVTREELNSTLKTHIRHLIYPLKTILDESLGCAFWFASQGNGMLNGFPYQTNCRVILLGSGADELFGGYTRHRNAFIRCKSHYIDKIEALRKELNMDWERIPSRNLGRDDRVISDNGRTARAPFIEENIVSFVQSLSPMQKCCFSMKETIGDKLLLRLCGFQLGLSTACTFKKRAIQFGSRIANKTQNAKDLSENLMS